MGRISAVIATACVAALALGGCGGGGYQGLSKADFVTQANAICTNGQKALDSIGASVGSSPTLATLQRTYSGPFLAAVREEVSQLRALKPPKADRTKSAAWPHQGYSLAQWATSISATSETRRCSSAG